MWCCVILKTGNVFLKMASMVKCQKHTSIINYERIVAV